MTARVGLFFVAWCGLSLVAGIIAGRIIAAAHRQSTPPVPPHGRQAVEPAAGSGDPSQAPAPPTPDLICDSVRVHPATIGPAEFVRRWRAAVDLATLAVLDTTTEWSDTDPTPPHGIPRPPEAQP